MGQQPGGSWRRGEYPPWAELPVVFTGCLPLLGCKRVVVRTKYAVTSARLCLWWVSLMSLLMQCSFSSLRETEEDYKSHSSSADLKAADLLGYFFQLQGGLGDFLKQKFCCWCTYTHMVTSKTRVFPFSKRRPCLWGKAVGGVTRLSYLPLKPGIINDIHHRTWCNVIWNTVGVFPTEI